MEDNKPKIYFIKENIYKFYLKQYINKTVKSIILSYIIKNRQELKLIPTKADKKTYIIKLIESLRSQIDLKMFEHFTYKFNIKSHWLSIGLESVIEVVEFYNYYKSNNKDIFTLLDHKDTVYKLDYYEEVEVDLENDLYKVFDSLHKPLYSDISNFIILKFWIKEIKKFENANSKLQANQNIISNIDLSDTNTTEKITKTNTEDIFKNGGFEIFEKYLSIDTGDNLKKKISFIFQQLKKEDKLRVTNFKILSEWAYNNRFIDKCTYGFLLQDGCFISPSKILTKGRTEKYNLMLNK